MAERYMLRNKLRLFFILLALLTGAAFWVLDIELTYERNIRRGIPADFRIHRPRALDTWRT
jgi:hypothetical protein